MALAADWPTVEELALVLDVDNLSTWGLTLERVRLAAIAGVKADVGWDESEDAPDESLAQAALRRAELIASRPSLLNAPIQDRAYNLLLFGHRRQFGISTT